MDDLDSDTLGHYLKIWLDKYPKTGEVKFGTIPLNYKTFIVTSNYSIEELFANNEKMIEPIRRRCRVEHMNVVW